MTCCRLFRVDDFRFVTQSLRIMPVALKIDWVAVALAASAGVPYPAIALKHGLLTPEGKPDTGAIRQRAKREQWPVPKRVHESAKRKAREALKAHHELKQSGVAEKLGYEIKSSKPVTRGKPVTMGFSASQSGENATVTVTDNLLDLAKAGSLRFAQVAHRSLQAMPDELLIASPSDAATTVKTLRSIAGMDKEGTTVNVAIGGGWSDWPEPVSQERDVTPVSTDIADY